MGHRRTLQWMCWIVLLGPHAMGFPASTGTVRDVSVHVWVCRSTAPLDVPIWTRTTAPQVQPVLEFFRLSGLAHTVVFVDHDAISLDQRPAAVWLACPYDRLPRHARARLNYWLARGTTLWITADMWADALSTEVRVERRVSIRVSRVRVHRGGEDRIVAVRPRTAVRITVHPAGAVRVFWTDDRAGHPLGVAVARGRGRVVLLAWTVAELWRPPPDRLDALLRTAIIRTLPAAVQVPLAGVAVLRMDDPQTSSKIWIARVPRRFRTRFPELTPAEWTLIGRILKMYRARMSLMYVSGFVDNGDTRMGVLFRNGHRVRDRRCGRIFPVREVRYVARHGTWQDPVYDFTAEYRAIRALVRAGRIDIESHGDIHMTAFLNEWCRARPLPPDREHLWMTEFYDLAFHRPVPRRVQRLRLARSVRRIERFFGIRPVVFAPPLHAYDTVTVRLAQQLGFVLMHALTLYDLSRRPILEIVRLPTAWAHLPLAGRPDPQLDASGFPIVVGWHDSDLRIHPVAWLRHYLRVFIRRGYTRLIGFRALAGLMTAQVAARYVPRGPDRALLQVDLDIAPTGGTGGPESRYFAHHAFPLRIHLPDGWQVVNGFDKSGRNLDIIRMDTTQWEVRIPPFGSHTRTRIVLACQRIRSRTR